MQLHVRCFFFTFAGEMTDEAESQEPPLIGVVNEGTETASFVVSKLYSFISFPFLPPQPVPLTPGLRKGRQIT